jgi:hypothetical protein
MQRAISCVKYNTDRHFTASEPCLGYANWNFFKVEAHSAKPDDRYVPEIPKTLPEPQGSAYDSRS